jgi:hypothetical protein
VGFVYLSRPLRAALVSRGGHLTKLVAILAAISLFVIGGIALADDPNGDLQSARDLLAQADALLAAEQAKPPVVTTVTETITTTETVTVTESAAPPPAPTTAPPPSCTGTAVAPGGGLRAAMDAAPAGTTFCLGEGTYTLSASISVQAGDEVIGAGRTLTHIDGSGVPTTAPGMFSVAEDARFEGIDVFGARTPAAGVTGACSPNANCGRAFVSGGKGTLTLQSIACHDNGGNCVGGGGTANLVADDLDCYANGNAYSMTQAFRYAACVKKAAAYPTGNDTGNVTITNSFIHDNPWVGIWCDFCHVGFFQITDSDIIGNGKAGVSYEVSGGETAGDHALVARNVIQDNGWNPNSNIAPTAISCNSCAELTIENNTFGGNVNALLTQNSRRGSWGDIFGVIVRDNVLGGDAVNCSAVGVSCSGNS